MRHVTSLADAPDWAIDEAKKALKTYELIRKNRSKEPNNYTIRSWIRSFKKVKELVLRDGRFLNREGSVLKQVSHSAPAGLGFTVKVLEEYIAYYESILATNKSPNFYINKTIYTLAGMFKVQTGSPCYQEVAIIIGEVFKGKGGIPKEMNDPAGWASQRVTRFQKLVRNGAEWKKAEATFERSILCNPSVSPPLKFNSTTPTEPIKVENLGNGKYYLQVPQSPDAEQPRNTITLKPRSLPPRAIKAEPQAAKPSAPAHK